MSNQAIKDFKNAMKELSSKQKELDNLINSVKENINGVDITNDLKALYYKALEEAKKGNTSYVQELFKNQNLSNQNGC